MGDKDLFVAYKNGTYNINLQSRSGYPNRSYTGTTAWPRSVKQFHYEFRFGTSDSGGNPEGFWSTKGY